MKLLGVFWGRVCWKMNYKNVPLPGLRALFNNHKTRWRSQKRQGYLRKWGSCYLFLFANKMQLVFYFRSTRLFLSFLDLFIFFDHLHTDLFVPAFLCKGPLPSQSSNRASLGRDCSHYVAEARYMACENCDFYQSLSFNASFSFDRLHHHTKFWCTLSICVKSGKCR